MTTWGWNCHLKPVTGPFEPLEIGKIVKFRGSPVFHYWARKGDKRRDIDAYGIREGVLAHALEHDVERFYYYEGYKDLTKWLDYYTIFASGVRGKTDDFGPTINIPLKCWGTIEGKLAVPYIKNEQMKYIDAGQRLEIPDLSDVKKTI